MEMDSTPRTPLPHKPSSASKLPIKRRTPEPNPQSDDPKPQPLKFPRIWTEHDEIRFLQGLLDCTSHDISFPRDLGIFYARFSNTMSQPYTKSQLSEKLRRLRKKFRVISTRLSKGLDHSQLSLHDRALYDLSRRLWHPDYAATSPFNGARNVGGFNINNKSYNSGAGERSGLVGIKVDFSPTLPTIASGFQFDDEENVRNDFDDDVKLELDCVNDEIMILGDGIEGGVVIGGGLDKRNDQEAKLSEVDVELEGCDVAMKDEVMGCVSGGVDQGKVTIGEDKISKVAAKAVLGVFEESFNDFRRRIEGRGGCGERSSTGAQSFHARWQKQRIAELDVLGKRLRLVLENSLPKHPE